MSFGIESCLYPATDRVKYTPMDPNFPQILDEKTSTLNKVKYHVENILLLIPAFVVSTIRSLSASCLWLASKISWTSSSKPKDPEIEGETSLADIPFRGFADSLFQSCGLGLDPNISPAQLNGTCDWNEDLQNRIEGINGREEASKFFTSYIKHPKDLIRILKNMNVNAYRFSFERSVLQNPDGTLNKKNVAIYRNFIAKLKRNNITPFGTLCHFVNQEEFTKNGGFEKAEEVDAFVKYSLAVINEFKDEITHWMTFNEPAIYAFQGYVRGVYPPFKTGDFAGAAKVLRNMLATHCEIYNRVKSDHPYLQIGITHQWLNFKPFNSSNPIERLICYVMSKITHYAALEFFKTGNFSLQIPFLANSQLQVDGWEKGRPLLDFMGVQTYGFPLIKAGFSTKPHPGYGIKNYLLFGKFGLTFGATCREGSHVQSFGPPFSPKDLEEVLEEASEVGVPIAITETGSDARIQKWGDKDFGPNDLEQRRYFEEVSPILQKFSIANQGTNTRLIAVLFWTVMRGHLEWDRGENVSLGLVRIVRKNQEGRIREFELTPAAQKIGQLFDSRIRDQSAA